MHVCDCRRPVAKDPGLDVHGPGFWVRYCHIYYPLQAFAFAACKGEKKNTRMESEHVQKKSSQCVANISMSVKIRKNSHLHVTTRKHLYKNDAISMKSPTCVQSDVMSNRKSARFASFPVSTEKVISISDQRLKIGRWQPFPLSAQQGLYLAGGRVGF